MSRKSADGNGVDHNGNRIDVLYAHPRKSQNDHDNDIIASDEYVRNGRSQFLGADLPLQLVSAPVVSEVAVHAFWKESVAKAGSAEHTHALFVCFFSQQSARTYE
jgi:hypothetical protein